MASWLLLYPSLKQIELESKQIVTSVAACRCLCIVIEKMNITKRSKLQQENKHQSLKDSEIRKLFTLALNR